MGPLTYLLSGVRLLTVLSITAIVGGIVLQGGDIAETAKRLSDSPSQLQGWIWGQNVLVSQAGDCSHETYPSWPDCETIECMSDGHYSCTKMKESSGGGGGCSGSPPTTSSWCENGTWKESTGGSTGGTWGGSGGGCSGSPPTTSSWCENGTWKESTGGSTGGTWGGSSGGGYCSGTPPTPSSWCDYSSGTPTWKESTGGYTGGSGGEWEASPAVQETCRNDCVTNGHFPLSECQNYCKDGNWNGSGGGSVGGWGGSSGGGAMGPGCPAPTFTDKQSCVSHCVTNMMMGGATTALMCGPICDDFNPCGAGGGSVGGWGGSSGGGCETSPGGCSGGMKRCFYTHATIGGKSPGFTVWCEEDYKNCHEGDPSGKSISNEGLQLGAPSQCEGGWGGSGGSGWTGGGGGTDEGGWDRSASCIRGCEEAPNSPECKTANPPQWCKTPVDQCKAMCGQGGQHGGGGTEGGWTPPDFDKPSAKPQCYKDPATDNMWYGNASIKGWNQIPKSDCESKGLRPGEWWNPRQHPAPGDFAGDEGWDTGGNMGGFGDYMGDLGGFGGKQGGEWGGDPNVDQQQLSREKQDMARNMKQRAREVKDMRRSLKDSRSENTTLASKIDEFESGIAGVTQCFESANDFDAMRDCYDLNNDLNDLTQEVWAALQVGNIARDLKNQERELKDMAREIARLEREDRDTSELNSLLEKIKSLQAEVLSLADNDPEEAQYRMQDLGDLKRDFWDAMQDINRSEQEAHIQQDLKRGCKDFEREAKRAPKELKSEVQELVKECQAIVAEAESDLAGGAEPWEVEEHMRDMQDLWPRFQEIMESQWGDQACHDAEFGLEQAGRAVEEEAPEIIDQVRDVNPAIADKMETLLDKAQSVLEEGRTALTSDDCDRAIDAVDTLHHDISERFDDLMRQAGLNPDEFEDEEFDYEDWADEFGFEFDDAAFDHFQDSEYGLKDRNLIQRIAAEVLEKYLSYQKDSDAPDILSSVTDLNLQTSDVQNLLEAKNTLLAEIDALRSQINSLKDELVAIVAEVERFTFGEETGKEAAEFIENELPYLTEEEAAQRLEELKEAAGEELYDDGIIPFEDTPVGEWYTDDAQKALDLGLVEGTGESDGTQLNPAGETNIAEALTMFARLDGIDEDAVPTSDIGTDLPEWAESAAGTLEDSGVDLDTILGDADASDFITRGEVAVLLTEVLDLPEADHTVAIDTFSDVTESTPDDVVDAIAAVYDAGLMTGYGDSDEFGVHDALNRAALVKILNLSHEEFVEGDDNHDVDDDE